ncbi:Rv2175c family DNA-binding protein [Microbacterium marinilacus]|uniref:Rv2175c family DNA-binding protein n=1 Tax=Microbacterium marinilacus TaxID=415209 RepID=A0ABP7B679_9MICO|nr:Rv2175c family DNA-binding protein [Microbacterium marinilacus]MBY0687794.1 DNA-binding protein [Microbacterium marinilacus]
MTANDAASTSPRHDRVATEWLTLPEVAELLGETPGRVRRLLDEKALVGSRREGPLRIPSVFFVDDEVLSSLRGTVIVLHDAGFDDDEAIDWLLTPEESIGDAPIEALRAGRKAEVRRVAQTLA